jgi:hypothetical protein
LTVRIAMWSGPRNISTAMMRAWENRPDTAVVDEPFYAAYLAATGIDHPMRKEVLAAQPTDPAAVAEALTGPIATPVFYQKHMTHHMLPGFDLSWMAACRHAFLIRAPEPVLASYTARRAEVTLEDIGFVRQAELFDRVADRLGKAPPVVESSDVLADPRGVLTALCGALDVRFEAAMLAWPAGRRDSDGVWAPAWYDAVERSTGFGSPGRATAFDDLASPLKAIAEAARPYYEHLARWRIRPPAAPGPETPPSR